MARKTHSTHKENPAVDEQATPAASPPQHLIQSHIRGVEERRAEGKNLRQHCPRKAHAEWKPPQNRPDPVDLLIQDSQGRMEQLIPLRYGRMLASPFTFFRGAAAIMASDLAYTPATGLTLQACGDCHLLNFGGFATAERRLIFDINDFDESSIAPWEWDIKRLATSFVIAGRSNGFKASQSREAAWTAAQSYRLNMAAYAEMPVLEAWYSALDLVEIITNMQDKQAKRFYTKKLESATKQLAHEKEFAKLAFTGADEPRIIDQPPLIFHIQEELDMKLTERIQETLAGYRESLPPERRVLLDRYRLVDAAYKVVGVGSVGTFCGIGLFMSGNGDPLFLQFKEAGQSVLEPYAGRSPYDHPGQRVVVGQRLMQAASDIFLGWMTYPGLKQTRYYYMRQLSDVKIKPVVELMNPSLLKGYATLCGTALARAHARSVDAAVLSGYLGRTTTFEDALAAFGEAYADQNEQDHAALLEAVRSGRLEARVEE